MNQNICIDCDYNCFVEIIIYMNDWLYDPPCQGCHYSSSGDACINCPIDKAKGCRTHIQEMIPSECSSCSIETL